MNPADQAFAVASFKSELAAAKVGHDLREGLEVAGVNSQKPVDTASLDPGWADFEARKSAEEQAQKEVAEAAAQSAGDAALLSAIDAIDSAPDDEQVIAAAMHLAATDTAKYGEFVRELGAAGPLLHEEVNARLGQASAAVAQSEFANEMALSEAMNVESARSALDAAAERRGLSQADVERAARSYMEATGQPLRSALLTIPEERRQQFVEEVTIQNEISERAPRLRQFAAGFFQPGNGDRSISAGLTGPGIERAPLPPSLLDDGYHQARIEQQIRREDEAKLERPSRETDAAIKRQLVESDGGHWSEGLTDASGRKTSLREIASKDPDSPLSVEQREAQRRALRLGALTNR